jgi:murein DD-endopeptidase MepM/ murein hydrolase activator NlpD
MADDVKLQLGIDVEALQRSATQATQVLTQAFEKGFGANLLGSGQPATQGPSQQGSKDTLRGVIDALERVDRTLVIGFNALAGGVYLGGGGGGGAGTGGGGAGGWGSAGALAQPTPATPVAGGRFGLASQILSRSGDLAAALMPSSMRMFMGGGYSTDVMGFVHNLVSQVPVAGKLLGAVTAPFHQVMQQNDEFKNMQYETFRDSGENAMNSFTNLWTDDDYREQFVKRYGFSRSETAGLVGAGARRGLGQGQGMETVLNLQGQLGLGQEGAETMGGLRRAGLKPGQETEVMATAIGIAVTTGLERGRWGEMLTMWQRAAQSSVDTDVAWKEVAAQQQFVGSLGARFQGDTPAAQSMTQALQGMTSNQQSPLALRAAMQLTGGDYFAATARMSRSAEQPDTEMQEAIINQMMGMPIVKAWLTMPDGPAADRALENIAGVAATFGTGVSQLKLITLLKAKKMSGGSLIKPVSPEATEIGGQYTTGTSAVPGAALGPRRSQSEAQRPSGISSIQGVGPVALGGSPQEQLRHLQESNSPQAATSLPTMSSMLQSTANTNRSMSGFSPLTGFPSQSSSSASSSSYRQFVMQGFGNQIPGRAPHPGVDLAFPPGTAVTCPVDGIIEEIHPNGTGLQVGTGIHIRAADGALTKIYHIDPVTFPSSLRVGQRIARGTALGRTYSNQFWQAPGGQQVRTHLHVGQTSAGGVGLDPMRPGGVAPGALTGGVVPQAAPAVAGGGGTGGSHVTADVHVHVHHDPSGRPMVRVRGATPIVTNSPGQIVGGNR